MAERILHYSYLHFFGGQDQDCKKFENPIIPQSFRGTPSSQNKLLS